MKNNRIEDYKNEYLKIETPSEISETIIKGIERGKKEMNLHSNAKNRVLKICASLVLATSILTGAVNVSPTFADTLSNIPVIGEIVKVLQFTNNEARGGVITDGTDIDNIDIIADETSEEIIIEFSNGDENQDIVGSYNIIKAEYPNTITFEIGGARRFTALDDFQKLSESQYVKEIYPLITLDDSLMRFVVVFNTSVDFNITEMKSPASLVININEKEALDQQSIYIVRTESMPKGETFGILEEQLTVNYDIRVIKDDNEWFVVELKNFDTKEEADAFITEYSKSSDIKLIVEERLENEIPKHSPASQN